MNEYKEPRCYCEDMGECDESARKIGRLFVSGGTIQIVEFNRYGEQMPGWTDRASDQAIADYETYLSGQKDLLDKLITQKARQEGGQEK